MIIDSNAKGIWANNENTGVQVEETANEDKIRMDVAGTEAFVLQDDGILDLAKQSRARAYLGSNQTVTTGGVPKKIELDTESYDNQGEFDSTTNYRFTATKAGYYQVNACILYNATVADKIIYSTVRKNGSDVIISYAHTSNTGPCSIVASDVVYLAANDYLELYTYHAFGSDASIAGQSYFTFMSVHKLS